MTRGGLHQIQRSRGSSDGAAWPSSREGRPWDGAASEKNDRGSDTPGWCGLAPLLRRVQHVAASEKMIGEAMCRGVQRMSRRDSAAAFGRQAKRERVLRA